MFHFNICLLFLLLNRCFVRVLLQVNNVIVVSLCLLLLFVSCIVLVLQHSFCFLLRSWITLCGCCNVHAICLCNSPVIFLIFSGCLLLCLIYLVYVVHSIGFFATMDTFSVAFSLIKIYSLFAMEKHRAADISSESSPPFDSLPGMSDRKVSCKTWRPTANEVRILLHVDEHETHTLSRDRIVSLVNELSVIRPVTYSNIYNWFRNRRSRDRDNSLPVLPTSTAPPFVSGNYVPAFHNPVTVSSAAYNGVQGAGFVLLCVYIPISTAPFPYLLQILM